MTAASLGRPCVVDMDSRDPAMTWRSFIGQGAYQWEPSTLKSDNVVRIIATLNHTGAGAFNDEFIDGEAMALFGSDDGNADAVKWSGTGEHSQKVMVSANWATGWFFHRPA